MDPASTFTADSDVLVSVVISPGTLLSDGGPRMASIDTSIVVSKGWGSSTPARVREPRKDGAD
jgi:hypothetical protein